MSDDANEVTYFVGAEWKVWSETRLKRREVMTDEGDDVLRRFDQCSPNFGDITRAPVPLTQRTRVDAIFEFEALKFEASALAKLSSWPPDGDDRDLPNRDVERPLMRTPIMTHSIGKSLAELSTDLRDRQDWEVGTLRTLECVLDANTFAFDPVSSILAVGTTDSVHQENRKNT
ncbi:hypothetical protein V8E52_010445 [Russula decolorans]